RHGPAADIWGTGAGGAAVNPDRPGRQRSPLSLACAALAVAGCAGSLKPGDPVRGLTGPQRDAFKRGRVVFDSIFTAQTGLGPLFNQTACGECHEDPAKGGVGGEVELHATAFRADGTCDPLVEEGGFVIQRQVTPALKAALGIDS